MGEKRSQELNAAPVAVRPDNCHTCRYSGVSSPGVPAMVCRYYPAKAAIGPQPNMVTGQMGMATFPMWPPVTEHDWCSKWAAKLSS